MILNMIRKKLKPGNSLNQFYSGLTVNLIDKKKLVEKLVDIFKPYHEPNYYDQILKKNSSLSRVQRASLLIPISFRKENNGMLSTYFTFSKRANKMRSYSNQNCFIGGKQDASDKNELQAVLREAYEEGNNHFQIKFFFFLVLKKIFLNTAGIKPTDLKLLAQLRSFLGTNDGSDTFIITPIVFYFDKQNYEPILNRDEVDSIFELPTLDFLSKAHHESNEITVYDDDYFFHYFYGNQPEKIIFGVTAFSGIVASTALHQMAPEFPIDPHFSITPKNLNIFLEDYVFKKALINAIKNK